MLSSPTIYDPVASVYVMIYRHASDEGWTAELGCIVDASVLLCDEWMWWSTGVVWESIPYVGDVGDKE